MQKLLENLIKKIYRLRGYEIGLTKLIIYEGTLPQNIIRTRSTYSPWEKDEAFQKVYQTARNYTKVDQLRCYELWQMVGETKDLEGDILEVGVWKGGTGAILAYRAQELCPNAKVFLGDTFEGRRKSG